MLRAGAQTPRHADPPLAGAAEKPSCGCAFTVIARWHENLNWTWKLRMPFVVMDKAAGNVGRESLSYLHFIVENYANRLLKMAENSSACVCFTQGIISGSQFGCVYCESTARRLMRPLGRATHHSATARLSDRPLAHSGRSGTSRTTTIRALRSTAPGSRLAQMSALSMRTRVSQHALRAGLHAALRATLRCAAAPRRTATGDRSLFAPQGGSSTMSAAPAPPKASGPACLAS